MTAPMVEAAPVGVSKASSVTVRIPIDVKCTVHEAERK